MAWQCPGDWWTPPHTTPTLLTMVITWTFLSHSLNTSGLGQVKITSALYCLLIGCHVTRLYSHLIGYYYQGWLAVMVTVKDEAKDYEGVAQGHIEVVVESPGEAGGQV